MRKQTETAKPNRSRKELWQARMRAIVLAAATLIAILFFMYGQIQKIEAESNLELAKQNQVEALKQRELAQAEQRRAAILTQELSEALRLLDECHKNQK